MTSINITAPASRLRFIASELVDEASRHRGSERQALTRAAQQCAAAAISVGNLAKMPANRSTAELARKTLAAAAAIDAAAIDIIVHYTLTRTPELHQEGTPA